MKGTYFCFTWFGVEDEIEINQIYTSHTDMIRYLGCGREVCPETGNIHYQCYIQMFKQCRASFIQKIFGEKFHIEVCRGTVEQNLGYCSKDGEYIEFGTPSSGQGYRSDLWHIKNDLSNGCSMYDIMNNYTSDFIRYSSGIAKMKSLIDYEQGCCDRGALNCVTLTGKAGVGKTSFVYKKHGYKNVFKLTETMYKSGFWGNYSGQDTLLIDEFNGWIRYKDMLDIMDRHPLPVNIKNGNTMARWKNVYICSNVKPAYFYKSFDIKDNFKRRISSCLEVTKGNTIELESPWKKDCQVEDEYAEYDPFGVDPEDSYSD